ncbi:MAG: hypothetical protein H0U27_01290, partial [Nitrosopumilus sp.]|nr:hypothetical protein [Nitrosopumilus sp.]
MQFNNITSDLINDYTEQILDRVSKVYDSIAAINPKSDGSVPTSDLSFKTILQPLIDVSIELTAQYCIVRNMSSFHTDKAVREASIQGKKRLADFNIECNMRNDVYNVIKSYYDEYYPKEKDSLTTEQCRYVERTMKQYRRNGLYLNNPEIKVLKQTISSLEIEFLNNINEDNTKFVFSKSELEGLPESWFHESKLVSNTTDVNSADVVDPDPKYTVTLKYPDYVPIVDYCRNEQVRKQLYIAYNSKCSESNDNILNQLIYNKDKLARMLGYQSHAHYAIEDKMAKTPEYVHEFIDGLIAGLDQTLIKEHDELTSFTRDLIANPEYDLQRWDTRYYTRLYKESKFNLDMEEMKQYFPLQKVLKGMLTIYETLLGLKFVAIETDNKWHESVSLYHVFNQDDTENKSLIGMFYLDLYPRDGKFNHAAMFKFVTGCIKPDGSRQIPIATMACNFPEHECMSFDDVMT